MLSSAPKSFETEKISVDNIFMPVMEMVAKGNHTKEVTKKETIWSKLSAFSFSMLLIIIPLLFVLLTNVKVTKKEGLFHEDALSVTNTKALLGFFAVCIMLHHIVQKVGAGAAGMMSFMEDMGVCFVGVFFFISGYGLMVSCLHKKNYLKDFFKKRFPTVLIPACIANLCYFIVALLQGENTSFSDIVLSLLGWKLLNSQMWYVVEIILFYFVFWLVFSFIKKKPIALTVMLLFLCCFTVYSLLLGHGEHWLQGEWWYNTSLLFGIGMVFSLFEKKIILWIRKYYFIVLGLSGVVFGILFYSTKRVLSQGGYWTESATSMGYMDKFESLFVQLPMVISFAWLLIVLTQKIQFQNKVLVYLGEISFEVYMIHNLFMGLLGGIPSEGMYMLAVVVLSLIGATVLHEVDKRLVCFCTGKTYVSGVNFRIEIQNTVINMYKQLTACIRYAKRAPKKARSIIFRHGICMILSFISIWPIYILFVSATKTSYGLVHNSKLIPEGHFLENFQQVIGYVEYVGDGLFKAELYSTILAVSSSLLAVYLGSLCAYGFETYKFKGRKQLWACIIATMTFSQVSGSVGFLHLTMKLHLLNTFIPLILQAAATPAVVYFMRMYLKMQPMKDVVEAARIDGSSEFMTFHKIILPAIKPALALQIIFTFVNAWNNMYMQSIILQWPELKTISLYLKTFASNRGASADPFIYVLLVLTTLPPLIVYLLLSKSIVTRIVLGSVKE